MQTSVKNMDFKCKEDRERYFRIQETNQKLDCVKHFFSEYNKIWGVTKSIEEANRSCQMLLAIQRNSQE